MAKTSTYLNFMGNTEEAFLFYAAAFQTEIVAPIMRYGDHPVCPDLRLQGDEARLVMHIELPIVGGHVLMGTDLTESGGRTLTIGNNVSINLQPDTRAETERLFRELGHGGQVTMPLQDMFWGDYFGALVDRYGVRWMFNCEEARA
jgi:PhnB protein